MTYDHSYKHPNECNHGRLARKCEICAYEKEIADLRSLLERTKEALERFADMGINDEDLYTDIAAALGEGEKDE